MSKVELLRAVMKRRRTAAAEEIYRLFERTMAEYRGGPACPAGEHTPQTSLAGNDLTHIKEEQEELCVSQEGQQLHGPVPVKSEEDEETAESSQLHQRQADGQMEPGADGEDCAGSEPGGRLRLLLKQRLSAAVDEIFGLFEATLAEYEEEIEGLHKLLGEAVKPEVQVNTADVLQLLVIKQEVPSEQQEWRIILNQEDPEPQQPPDIKEEQEDLWSSKEEEQLHRPVAVKSEDDEETAQSSQLHHRQTDEQMETRADGEDCGALEPGRIFGPACDLQQESEGTSSSDPDTENSDDYSQKRSSPLSGLVTPKYNENSVSHKEKLCGSDAVISNQNVKNNAGGKPFSCSICGKGFGDKSELKRHIRFHTGEKPFSCTLCDKNFTESADLKRHMRVHTGEKPFSCPICHKCFGEKTDMTRHIRVHTGEKPFSCSICGKIFSQRVNLNRHERIHTGEKPFSCQVCAKQFTHRGGLAVHMRIHTGEKPFDCSICGNSYRETGNLKKHMRVHTGEKPFSCSVCERRFTNRSQVKSHKCSGESNATVVQHS